MGYLLAYRDARRWAVTTLEWVLIGAVVGYLLGVTTALVLIGYANPKE